MADAGIGETAAITAATADAGAKGAEAAGAAAADAAGTAGTIAGADALAPVAAAGAPLDLLAGGTAAGTAIPAGVGEIGATGLGAAGGGLTPELSGAFGAGEFGAGLAGFAGGGGEGGSAPLGFASPDAAGGAPAPFSGPGAPAAGASPSNFALPTGSAPGALPPDPTSAIAVNPAPGAAPGAPAADPFAAGAVNAPIQNVGATGLPSANVAPAAPGTVAAPASPSGGGGIGDFFSKLGQGAVKSVTNNPLGIALGAGGLGYNILQGQAKPQGTPQLNDIATQLAGQSAEMRSYLSSGTLPPGLQAGVDQGAAAAKARIISNYASRGLPTDPTKNSALAQELSAVDANIPIVTAQIGQQLLTSGISEAGLSEQIYQSLAQIDQTQTANTGKAIANFASALGGGGTKVPGTGVTVSTSS